MGTVYLLTDGKQEVPCAEEQVRRSFADDILPSDLPAGHEGLLANSRTSPSRHATMDLATS